MMPDSGERAIDRERLERLFETLMTLPPAERAARLAALHAEDAALADELASLAAYAPHADRFFRQAPLAVAAVAAELIRSRSGDPGADRTPSVVTDDHSGRVVAQYQVGEPLGRGGMGVVYRATDTRLGRPVALKFLPPHLSADGAARARLRREAHAAAALDHPNICTVYEVGETAEGALFIAMACYEGETLRARLARGPLEPHVALAIATQTARALCVAHAGGIVHRDVKPANLMLATDGTVKLLDFGLARLVDATMTGSGLTPGTVAYMAPEQVRGERVDARSDLWALGVVLYEMLAGRRPFRGDSEAAVLHAILTRPVNLRREHVSPSAVPEPVARVVERLLQKEPEARYRSAEALVADLSALERGEATPVVPTRGSPRWRTWRAGNRTATLVLPTIVVIALGGLWWRPGPGGPEVRAGAATSPRTTSLAVLPFVSASGDSAQDVVADGMAGELTTSLARVAGLRVIAHESVRRLGGTARSVPQITRALDVTHVVTGSVLQDGDSVRMTVTVIDAARDTPIWSDRLVRGRHEILALRQELALAIARAVGTTPTPLERSRLADAAAVDPAAFELFVRGTQARYQSFGSDDRKAMEFFERAVATDPTFAPAYAGLAIVHSFSGDEARARTFAERALALDPALAEARMALGLIRSQYDRDWAGAERSFREAIQLTPGYAEAHHELSMLLMRRRRFEEALHEARLALYLAPMSARFAHGLGEVHLARGRSAEALLAAERAFALDSTAASRFLQAYAYVDLGRFEEATATLERCIPLGCGNEGRALLGYVYGVTGRREEALRVADSLRAQWAAGSGGPGVHYLVAQVLAGLGERERALDWLERGEGKDVNSLYAAIDPTLRSLRGDPRFRALLRQLGLDG